MNDFYKPLNYCKIKPVALSLVNLYAKDFILKSRDIPTVSDLFDKKYLTFEYHELLKACTDISINISERDIKLIEKDTRKQSKGASFYHHRAGRIGASLPFIQILLNPHNLLSICYPNLFKFSTAATEHGCKHEDQAIETFENVMRKKHIGYRTIECGMFINKQFPWLHATPDFLSWCKCCGYGCGEVKCPYCLDGVDFESYTNKGSSSLEVKDGKTNLKREHQYYYQVQQQLFTTELPFCDFIVCGFNDKGGSLINERIIQDKEHWENNVSKLSQFSRNCVLSKILGR